MNNKSIYYKDWTTKKLVEELKLSQFLVFDEECYGVCDLLEMLGISRELKRRGYKEKDKKTYTRKEVLKIIKEVKEDLLKLQRGYGIDDRGIYREDIETYFKNYEV